MGIQLPAPMPMAFDIQLRGVIDGVHGAKRGHTIGETLPGNDHPFPAIR